MAGQRFDERHLKILRGGPPEWNAWRNENPEIVPDLRKANILDPNGGIIDFSGIDFRGVHLHGTKFGLVDFSGAKFSGAIVNDTDFSDVKNLSQDEINVTHHYSGHPPKLPEGMTPPEPDL